MRDFEIIDAHIHLARTKEEEEIWWPIPGRRACDRYGTPERALEYMDRSGISMMAFMNLIPRQARGPLAGKTKLQGLSDTERQEKETAISEQIAPIMREFNEWGCEIGKRFPRLLPFICISKELGDPKAIAREVELRADQGAKGIKMHPGVFCSLPNDEAFWPAYEKCQELDLPIIADSMPWPPISVLVQYSAMAVSPVESTIHYGEPKHWAQVAEAFPRLTIILAHIGAAWWDERIELAQKYSNVFFDTAQGFAAPDRIPLCSHQSLAEEDVIRVFRKIGVERIMFGTDFPGLDSQPQLEQLLRIPFSDEEKKLLLAENAKRILHI